MRIYMQTYSVKGFLLKILFIFRERGREGHRDGEKHLCVRDQLLLTCPELRTWPATQACALTGNRNSDLSVCGPALNLLSHTSQGWKDFLFFQRQGKRRRKREISMCGCLSRALCRGPSLQPRHVPLWFAVWCSVH